MSWLKVEVLECDICSARWQGRPSRPRAFVVSRARMVGGWHTNSHGVLVVCRACIDSPHSRFSSVAEHAGHLRAHDIPNALLLAELVEEARFFAELGRGTAMRNERISRCEKRRARGSGPD
jgi:hypothetical protein